MISYKSSPDIEYNGTENCARMQLFADTSTELTGVTHFDGILLLQGSTAYVISSGEKWMLDGSGSWILQPSDNAWQNVYTKAEIDTMITTIYNIMMYYHTSQESADGTITFYTLGTPVGSLTIHGNGEQTGTPTPDNPVMPEFVGVRTAQLFDKNAKSTTNGFMQDTMLQSDGTTLAWNVFSVSEYIPIESGAEYYISDVMNAAFNAPSACFYDSSKQFLSSVVYQARNSFGFSVPAGAAYVRISYMNTQANAVMLNAGSTALPYEPFGYKIPITCAGQTTPVYLGEVPTVRRIKKLVLTGEEEYLQYSGSTGVGARLTVDDMRIPSSVAQRANGYCTHFVPTSAPSGATGDNITFGTTINVIYLILSVASQQDLNISTFDEFKAYLAAQYAAGTPVVIWYVLAEPQTAIVNEPLAKIGDYADELSSADAGVSIPTFRGQNTLTVDTELPPSKIIISGE